MNQKIGIDAIDFYIPELVLPINILAEARDIDPNKLEKGLGLKSMALIDTDEDAASMAANALNNLIENNDLDPNTIGRIYLGTESAVDGSKPTATYAVGAVEKKLASKFGKRCFKHCDVVDLTFACIGAVDAMQNCLDWVRINPSRKAVVIASDIAKYDLGSSGEYTQGAGAVAILITSDPSIITIKDSYGVSMEHVGDFFKPRRVITNKDLNTENITIQAITKSEKLKMELFFEEPVFDGYYSNECYLNRIKEALDHYKSQNPINYLTDWDFLVFHLPYAFQGRRMILDVWLDWITENNLLESLENEIGKKEDLEFKDWKKAAAKSTIFRTFITDKISYGELASSEIGNMYTGSIFMSLLSILQYASDNNLELKHKTVGFISYGSGSKSKVFEGEIAVNWNTKIKFLDLFNYLNRRKIIDFETYKNLHNGFYTEPLTNKEHIKLEGISETENKEGFRIYN